MLVRHFRRKRGEPDRHVLSLQREHSRLCAVDDLGMYRDSLRGNREVPYLPLYEGIKAALGSSRT